MRESFSKKDLIMSLACPITCGLWATVRLIVDLTSGVKSWAIGGGCFALSCILAFLIGGVLCSFLTVALRIHTEGHLKKRVLVILSMYAINSIIGRIGISVVKFIYYMVFGVGGVIFQILKVQDKENTKGERFILIFSDPILYWTIYWFTFYFVEFIVIK